MILFPALASLINFIDLSLPAEIGITTPGNKTVLRKGKIGNEAGNSSLFISSSSSGVKSGINSASVSNSCNIKLSKDKIEWFDMFGFYISQNDIKTI